MKRYIGIFFLCAAALAAAGCGGTGTGQQSSVNFDMAILGVEGEFLIQGQVYNDLNGNGVIDMGEPGIPGVAVSLVGVEDTVTDSTGMYFFGVDVSRAYTVSETDPAGFVSTTPNVVVVDIVDQGATVDFGDMSEAVTYYIFGVVFDDINGNGIMDTVEPGIPDVMVALEGITDVMTGMDGAYAFAVADTGEYTVVETDPDGYVSTTPNEVTVTLTDMDMQVNFGDRFVAEVPVDVKPGSDVNPLNLRSKGVLPVAILGSDEFDVTQIDPGSLLLNGVAPLRWSYADVCGPGDMSMDPDRDKNDGEMPDGYADLTLKFSTQEIAASLGDVKRGDVVTLIMTGNLMDGTLAYGEEMVWIVQVRK